MEVKEIIEEDASNLTFGGEIPANSYWLSTAEALVVLNEHKEKSANRGRQVSPIVEATLEYARRFGATKSADPAETRQALDGLRHTLDAQGDPNPGEGNKEFKRKLHPFEAAMLVNLFLMPGGDDPLDEARALIPSLWRTEELGERFSDDEIEGFIRSVKEYGEGAGGLGMGGPATEDMELEG